MLRPIHATQNARAGVKRYDSMTYQSEVTELGTEIRPARPRCNAKAKQTGGPCGAPAMGNGKCRVHGGLSTGAKSIAGKIRVLAGLWQYAGCRKNLLAVALAFEEDRAPKKAFDRLMANNSPHTASACKAVVRYIADDFKETDRNRRPSLSIVE